MAKWLKAAEDLFEVVDRRAKLVVGDKPDDLPVPTPGSNGRGSKPRRSRTRTKPQNKLSSTEAPTTDIDTEREKTIPETSQSQAEPDEIMPVDLLENNDSNSGSLISKVDRDDQQKADTDSLTTDTFPSETISNDEAKPVGDHLDAETSSNTEAMASNVNGDLRMEESADTSVGSQPNAGKDVDMVNDDPPVDSSQTMMSEVAGSLKSSGEPLESQSLNEDATTKSEALSKDFELVSEPDIQNKQHQEEKIVDSAVKVQEQLEEAQGLLKSANSSGQSKEARLARVCAGLSSRLQEYKFENAQLEELLVAERELTKSYGAHIRQLQKDLSASKGEANRVEANMVDALSAKNAEIEALVGSVDSLKKQAALAERNLESLQASMESIMRNRELTETRMMQALREELAAAERRAEEERSAHNAAKLAAREREVELEQRAIEAASALARTQRTADDRASKAAELEQKVALLEVECASLNQELQDMEARVRRGQKKSPEDGSQAIQVQAWQEEVERARQGQREAESKLSSIEAEVQKMRVEMAAMKRDAEHYSRQEHMELEKRYRELTDLLYYKQTQLETMASEKAAAEFQLEKEVKHLHEAQLEAERNRASRRASSSWEEDTDMKALEPLPLYQRHMAGASLQLQKAAKLLDTGAVRATKFFWRYPIARIILLFYLVFVHLFLMYLLHRLQEQADSYTSKEFEESMGLLNKTLP
ncbi:hypothetical protein CASFOL_030894 [Castilleja foliolosa]|uniref:Golgin-84 n=1 Tax=Castilleja foliolosa TaxID=1961234 RepID=A0ABD3C6L0_9LAMI